MGIKDNFQQALRELTGTEKEDAKRGSSVDAIKNAVSAGDGSEYDTVGGSSYDEIQKRAAAAADEMTRQQSAYLDVTYHNDDGGRAGAETDQGDMTMGLPESGESTEPLRISGFENNTAGRTAAGTPAGDPARPSRNADPYENQASRSASDPYAGSPYSAGNQSASMPEASTAVSSRERVLPPVCLRKIPAGRRSVRHATTAIQAARTTRSRSSRRIRLSTVMSAPSQI